MRSDPALRAGGMHASRCTQRVDTDYGTSKAFRSAGVLAQSPSILGVGFVTSKNSAIKILTFLVVSGTLVELSSAMVTVPKTFKRPPPPKKYVKTCHPRPRIMSRAI